MIWLLTLPTVERALPLVLFVLYLITAFRLCRYSSWMRSGAPNPFLPRKIKVMLRKREISQMAKGRFPAIA